MWFRVSGVIRGRRHSDRETKAINLGEVLRINWSHGSTTVRSVSVAALITAVTLLR
jgi:hypothetical protein